MEYQKMNNRMAMTPYEGGVTFLIQDERLLPKIGEPARVPCI
jgi:hypothetical protein